MICSEQERLISELNQGRKLIEQLKNHIDHPTESQGLCEYLVQQIISIYDNALLKLNLGDLVGDLHQVAPNLQPLAAGSPMSEVSDLGLTNQLPKDVYKKRKTSQRWTEQIRVSSATGQGNVEDSYSWRKYGQKEILGASYPRAYYRCTHRHTQGCLATKLVQRSDEDSSIFEVTYKGRHTCVQASQVKDGLGRNRDQYEPQWEDQVQTPPEQGLFNLGTSLTVKTEDPGFPPFSFSSPQIEPEIIENNIFIRGDGFLGIDSLESNSFSVLQENNCGLSQNLQHSESELTDILSAPTSATNSPVGAFGFPFDQVDLDSDFLFDTSEFLS
ncbi:hypothetical protein NMG60_11022758 [Bertholletia excelsa]